MLLWRSIPLNRCAKAAHRFSSLGLLVPSPLYGFQQRGCASLVSPLAAIEEAFQTTLVAGKPEEGTLPFPFTKAVSCPPRDTDLSRNHMDVFGKPLHDTWQRLLQDKVTEINQFLIKLNEEPCTLNGHLVDYRPSNIWATRTQLTLRFRLVLDLSWFQLTAVKNHPSQAVDMTLYNIPQAEVERLGLPHSLRLEQEPVGDLGQLLHFAELVAAQKDLGSVEGVSKPNNIWLSNQQLWFYGLQPKVSAVPVACNVISFGSQMSFYNLMDLEGDEAVLGRVLESGSRSKPNMSQRRFKGSDGTLHEIYVQGGIRRYCLLHDMEWMSAPEYWITAREALNTFGLTLRKDAVPCWYRVGDRLYCNELKGTSSSSTGTEFPSSTWKVRVCDPEPLYPSTAFVDGHLINRFTCKKTIVLHRGINGIPFPAKVQCEILTCLSQYPQPKTETLTDPEPAVLSDAERLQHIWLQEMDFRKYSLRRICIAPTVVVESTDTRKLLENSSDVKVKEGGIPLYRADLSLDEAGAAFVLKRVESKMKNRLKGDWLRYDSMHHSFSPSTDHPEMFSFRGTHFPPGVSAVLDERRKACGFVSCVWITALSARRYYPHAVLKDGEVPVDVSFEEVGGEQQSSFYNTEQFTDPAAIRLNSYPRRLGGEWIPSDTLFTLMKEKLYRSPFWLTANEALIYFNTTIKEGEEGVRVEWEDRDRVYLANPTDVVNENPTASGLSNPNSLTSNGEMCYKVGSMTLFNGDQTMHPQRITPEAVLRLHRPKTVSGARIRGAQIAPFVAAAKLAEEVDPNVELSPYWSTEVECRTFFQGEILDSKKGCGVEWTGNGRIYYNAAWTTAAGSINDLTCNSRNVAYFHDGHPLTGDYLAQALTLAQQHQYTSCYWTTASTAASRRSPLVVDPEQLTSVPSVLATDAKGRELKLYNADLTINPTVFNQKNCRPWPYDQNGQVIVNWRLVRFAELHGFRCRNWLTLHEASSLGRKIVKGAAIFEGRLVNLSQTESRGSVGFFTPKRINGDEVLGEISSSMKSMEVQHQYWVTNGEMDVLGLVPIPGSPNPLVSTVPSTSGRSNDEGSTEAAGKIVKWYNVGWLTVADHSLLKDSIQGVGPDLPREGGREWDPARHFTKHLCRNAINARRVAFRCCISYLLSRAKIQRGFTSHMWLKKYEIEVVLGLQLKDSVAEGVAVPCVGTTPQRFDIYYNVDQTTASDPSAVEGILTKKMRVAGGGAEFLTIRGRPFPIEARHDLRLSVESGPFARFQAEHSEYCQSLKDRGDHSRYWMTAPQAKGFGAEPRPDAEPTLLRGIAFFNALQTSNPSLFHRASCVPSLIPRTIAGTPFPLHMQAALRRKREELMATSALWLDVDTIEQHGLQVKDGERPTVLPNPKGGYTLLYNATQVEPVEGYESGQLSDQGGQGIHTIDDPATVGTAFNWWDNVQLANSGRGPSESGNGTMYRVNANSRSKEIGTPFPEAVQKRLRLAMLSQDFTSPRWGTAQDWETMGHQLVDPMAADGVEINNEMFFNLEQTFVMT